MTDEYDLSEMFQGHHQEGLAVSKARAAAVVGELDTFILLYNTTKHDAML